MPEARAANTDVEIQDDTGTDQIGPLEIPKTIDFPHDSGYKSQIYEILYEAYMQDRPRFTLEEITDKFAEKIFDPNSDELPPSTAKIKGHIIRMEITLAKYGISIIDEEKRKKYGGRSTTLYKINVFDKNRYLHGKTEIKEVEDTEINKIQYIISIRDILPEGTFFLALEIVKRPGITYGELQDTTVEYENLYPKLEKLRQAGSSPKLPQRFEVRLTREKNSKGVIKNRYDIVIYKRQQAKNENMEDNQTESDSKPEVIQELLEINIKTIFDLRKEIQKLIQQTLSSAEMIELRGKYEKPDDERALLTAKHSATILISSELANIIKTLEVLSEQKPGIARTTNIIKEKLESVLRRHKESKAKEFSKGLRAELDHL